MVDEKQTNTKTNLIKAKGLLFGTKQLLQNSSDFILQIQGKDIEKMTKIDYLEVSMNSFTEKSIPTLFVQSQQAFGTFSMDKTFPDP